VSGSIDTGREVLRKEAEAILQVLERLGESFEKAVTLICECTGRVVFTGIGKSGLVCRKAASTLSSVGTPSFFLHPADSLHGDLGMLQKNDLLVIISNSGETEEIIKILPWIKREGIPTVVITGNPSSTIALQGGDVSIDVKVEEACPFHMVPTSSTTAALALADALAVAVMERKSFNVEDFANLHPGGTLGRRLLLRVEDLMHGGEAIPRVYEHASMKQAILEITSKRLGLTGVFDRGEALLGIITDGDLRRAIERYENVLTRTAGDVMTRNPKTIQKDILAVYALDRMEKFSITSLFVLEKEGDEVPVGIIHIHDLLKAKIV
jgi:arabinose-5-phosphate isomerase